MNGLVDYDSDSDVSDDTDSACEDLVPAEIVTSKPSCLLSGLPAPVAGLGEVADQDLLNDEVKRKEWEVSEAPKPPPSKVGRIRKQIVLPDLEEVHSDDSDDGDSAAAFNRKRSKPLPKEKTDSVLLSLLPMPQSSMFQKMSVRKNTDLKPRITRQKIPEAFLKKPSQLGDPNEVSVESSVGPSIGMPKSKSGILPNGMAADSDSDDEESGGFFSLNQDAEASSTAPSSSGLVLPPVMSKVTALEGPSLNYAETYGPDISVASMPDANNEQYSVSEHVGQYGYPEVEATSSSAPMSGTSVWVSSEHEFLENVPKRAAAAIKRDKLARLEFDMDSAGGSQLVEVVEANADAVLGSLAEVKDRLLKNYSEEKTNKERVQKAKEEPEPSAKHKKKHQITYLAHYAKTKEVELELMWSQHRVRRSQSLMKYGF